uniref:C2H2-type domain-containing protein n=1 Tax=Borely moumouvirus TaxID=2712067 RepID=A0A6G6ABD1_9VIRU
MPVYKCDSCYKEFDHKSNYDRHLNRIRSCVKSISGSKTSKVTNHICKSCSRVFSRKDSLTRHFKNCKGPVVKKKINKKYATTIKGNDNNVTIENNKNCNNTYIINLTITSDFAKDGIDNISAKELTLMLNPKENLWRRLIESVNFNPDKPEHHNVYYPDMKSAYGIVYENKKWNKKKIYEIMNKLLDAKVEDLNSILNEMSDCLSKKSINKIKEAIEDTKLNKEGSRKKLITYLKPILYNNKDMIMKTRKHYEEGNDILKKGVTFKEFKKKWDDKKNN